MTTEVIYQHPDGGHISYSTETTELHLFDDSGKSASIQIGHIGLMELSDRLMELSDRMEGWSTS